MKLKPAEQFLKDHSQWLKLYLKNQTTLDECPTGKDYNLMDASLKNSDLRYANLENADLRYADLTNANLRGANLFCATLIGANLSEVNLKNTDLEGAKIDTKWKKELQQHNNFSHINWVEFPNKNDEIKSDNVTDKDIESGQRTDELVFNLNERLNIDNIKDLMRKIENYIEIKNVLIAHNVPEESARDMVAYWYHLSQEITR